MHDYDIQEPTLEEKMANIPVERRRGQYKKLKTLGQGQFGKVLLVRSREHKLFACKMIQVGAVDPEEIEDALTEVEVLESFHHPCIVGFHEAYLTRKRSTLCIVMDYCGHGDLEDLIKKRNKEKNPIDETSALQIIVQCLLALQYLHSNHVLHRDIKPANVLRAGQHLIKLADFGLCRVMENTRAMATTEAGTPYYS